MTMPPTAHWFRLMLCVLSPIVLLSPAFSQNAAPAAASRPASSVINLAGVDMFLELTALLENDREPTEEQWDRLFSTPGYAVLIKREFRRDFFITRFKLAFMPSLKGELEGQMKKDTGFWAQFLPHYLKAKELRKEIVRLAAELGSADFAEEALQCARQWLPELHTDERPSVAFVVFAPDSRGYDPVVIDILYKSDREEFLNMVAHEFHHWYRNRMALDLTRDQDLLWVIEQMHLEGMAGLINIPAQMKKAEAELTPQEKLYLDSYRQSPEIIRTIDSLLARMQESPANRRVMAAKLKAAVPMSGHPTGYFMAETIVRELGKDALIRTTSNPFAFFALYSKAARNAGTAPPLSEKSLQFLRSLADRYGRCI